MTWSNKYLLSRTLCDEPFFIPVSFSSKSHTSNLWRQNGTSISLERNLSEFPSLSCNEILVKSTSAFHYEFNTRFTNVYSASDELQKKKKKIRPVFIWKKTDALHRNGFSSRYDLCFVIHGKCGFLAWWILHFRRTTICLWCVYTLQTTRYLCHYMDTKKLFSKTVNESNCTTSYRILLAAKNTHTRSKSKLIQILKKMLIVSCLSLEVFAAATQIHRQYKIYKLIAPSTSFCTVSAEG